MFTINRDDKIDKIKYGFSKEPEAVISDARIQWFEERLRALSDENLSCLHRILFLEVTEKKKDLLASIFWKIHMDSQKSMSKEDIYHTR